MKKAELDAVRMVREIRDRHAAALKGKSADEVAAFYNKGRRRTEVESPKATKKSRRSA